MEFVKTRILSVLKSELELADKVIQEETAMKRIHSRNTEAYYLCKGKIHHARKIRSGVKEAIKVIKGIKLD